MEIIIIGIVILPVIALIFFISHKIDNVKHRATQHVLNKAGVGATQVNKAIETRNEKEYMEKIMAQYPNLNENAVRQAIYDMAMNLANNVNNGAMSPKVVEKMGKDKTLRQMATMNFVRASVMQFKGDYLCATCVFTDGRDEYEVVMDCRLSNGTILMDKFEAMKAMTVGF